MFDIKNEDEIKKYKSLEEKYSKLAEKLRIKREIDNLNLEIEKLKVKSDLEEKDFSTEIQDVTLRLEILREESVEDTSKTIDLLVKRNQVSLIKDRLKKLEEKKGSISENVFNKLKLEYEIESESLMGFIIEEVKLIEDLHQKSNDFIQNYKGIKEELDIRLNLSDFTEDDYDKKIEELNETKRSAESLQEITDLLLEELKL